jgi:hypothetical protein
MITTFVMHVRSSVMLSAYCPTVAWKIFVKLVGVLFVGINFMAILGLMLAAKWGRFFSYLAIGFTTIYFGINYIPLSHFVVNGPFLALCGNGVLVYWIMRLHTHAAVNEPCSELSG